MNRFILKNARALTVTWFLVIFALCATPGEYIPSDDWMELLSIDKFVHATMFFIMTALLFVCAIKYEKKTITYTLFFLGSVFYGLLLEFMQATLFRNRSADWKDMIANSFGCFVAVLMLKKLRARFSQPYHKN